MGLKHAEVIQYDSVVYNLDFCGNRLRAFPSFDQWRLRALLKKLLCFCGLVMLFHILEKNNYLTLQRLAN